MSRSTLLAVGALTLIVGACRDGVAPYDGIDRQLLEGARVQLTFSPGNDLHPTWSKNGDTVYYTTTGLYDYPQQTAIVRLPRTGGIAHLIAPGSQGGAPAILALPVMSPQQDRVAFVQLARMLGPAVCVEQPACSSSEPLIHSGVLRVRDASATGLAGQDPGLVIPFEGVDPGRVVGKEPYLQRLFPFQAAYRTTGAMLFRPSWSPDGQRLVFSDGLKLSVWDPAQPAASVIPNTMDGVSPAWSPSGDRIAFTRLVRTDSVRTTCACKESVLQVLPDTHFRWTYVVSAAVITLINPDGTNIVDLTNGAEPAWSPDGSTLYFTRADQIYRIARTGGSATPIAQTEGGRSPAVSPDGKWLAFTQGSNANQNVFILSLGAQ